MKKSCHGNLMEVMLERSFESVSVSTVMFETLWQSVETGGEEEGGRKGELGEMRGALSPQEGVRRGSSSVVPLDHRFRSLAGGWSHTIMMELHCK